MLARQSLEEVLGLARIPESLVELMCRRSMEAAGGLDTDAPGFPSRCFGRCNERLPYTAPTVLVIDDKSRDTTPRAMLVSDRNERDSHNAE
jgi:hypothetical protein